MIEFKAIDDQFMLIHIQRKRGATENDRESIAIFDYLTKGGAEMRLSREVELAKRRLVNDKVLSSASSKDGTQFEMLTKKKAYLWKIVPLKGIIPYWEEDGGSPMGFQIKVYKAQKDKYGEY